jgi:hypothetical protein
MKYSILFSEIYNPLLHGIHIMNNNKYLLTNEFSYDELLNNEALEFCEMMREHYTNNYLNNPLVFKNHTIQNYENIVLNPKYYMLDIGIIINENGEYHCYLKTFWLRIFQLKYKKYFNYKMELIKKRKNIRNILKKELTGKW